MSAPGSLAGCGAAALLAALLAAWPAMGQAAEPLAARVNGAGISRQRLDRFTEEHAASQGRSAAGIQSPRVWRRLVREALDQLVDDELLGQEAVRLGHAPAPEVVERALAEARAAFPLPVQFELRLERSGFTGASFRAHLARQLAVVRLLERDLAVGVVVGDAEVHAWYLEHGEATGQPEAAAREVIRERLRRQRVEAVVVARLAALRQAARLEILVPLGDQP
ncbi:MAG: SurA N-terminal domain-containing protein [Anaeromyxobacter sp.]|nr:SurA N-terminal domain-containing protein [Anaeromyxobacter sp.]